MRDFNGFSKKGGKKQKKKGNSDFLAVLKPLGVARVPQK